MLFSFWLACAASFISAALLMLTGILLFIEGEREGRIYLFLATALLVFLCFVLDDHFKKYDWFYKPEPPVIEFSPPEQSRGEICLSQKEYSYV